MNAQDLSTKQKLLETAYKLFCNLGFDKTSMRQIAQDADVNLASINYYFNSKENLFLESLSLCYSDTQKQIADLIDQKRIKNTAHLAVEIYRLFVSEEHELRKKFKLMMFDAKEIPGSMHKSIAKEGPPAGKFLAEFIIKDLQGKKLSEKDLRWTITSIFAHITHMALVSDSIIGRSLRVNQPQFWSQKAIEEGIERLVKSIISSMN